MDVFRRLERRLEGLLDGVIGGVFRGALHPSELVGKVARAADLGSHRTESGVTVVPNRFTLVINPDDLGGVDPPPSLAAELGRAADELAFERGWRMEGPATVDLVVDHSAAHGNPRCDGVVRPGTRRPWATLAGPERLAIRVNHAVVGRDEDADVVMAGSRVSRRHARIWQEAGGYHVVDVGSSNGTSVDGQPIGRRAADLTPPTMITFGDRAFRFEVS